MGHIFTGPTGLHAATSGQTDGYAAQKRSAASGSTWQAQRLAHLPSRRDLGGVPEEVQLPGCLNEVRLARGVVSSIHPDEMTEIVTCVFSGSQAQDASTDLSGVIHAKEFQHIIIGRGCRLKGTAGEPPTGTHFFELCIRAPGGRPQRHGGINEQKRFTRSRRHNVPCAVASPRRTGGISVRAPGRPRLLHVLEPGRHLVHPLRPVRNVWVHVIHGRVIAE